MQNTQNGYGAYDWSQNNEQLTPPPPPGPAPISRGQKIAVAVLGFFAIAVFMIWIVQTKEDLGGQKKVISEEATCPDGNCGTSVASQRTKDTDKDGLTDFDELNIHGTSPYIEDSDSDGIPDGQEVAASQDPNCPTGQDCQLMAEPATTAKGEEEVGQMNSELQKTADSFENNKEGAAQASGLLGAGSAPVGASTDLQSAEKIMQGQGDAAGLRQMLLSSGMDKTVLDQISDEELMTEYQKVIAGTNNN
jgi:hypothetical protein